MKLKHSIFLIGLLLVFFFSKSETIDTSYYSGQVKNILSLRNISLDSSLAVAKYIEQDLKLLSPYPKLLVEAQNQIAISYALVGDIITAHKYFKLNTEADTSLLDLQTKGSVFNNVGISYMEFGQFSDAIKNFIISLKYREKLKKNTELAASYSNIGLCYFRQDLYEKALIVYYKGLDAVLNPEFKDTSLFTKIHNNIGLIFLDQHKLDSAEYHFNISKTYLESINETYDLCGIYAYLSELFIQKDEMQKAIEYNQKALKLSKEIGNDYDYYLSLIDLAQIYFYTNEINKVKPILDTLYQFYTFRNDKWQLINIYDFYADYYESIKDYKTALSYKDSLITLKDSIFNQESTAKQRELEAIYENDKQQLTIENLSNENEAKSALIAKENTQKIAFGVGLILMIIIALISLKAYRTKAKSQELIAFQKNVLEVKNNEITDSINYAKRIQSAILPSDKLVKQLFPNSFILYKPKDIVAGDFYWMETIDSNELGVMSGWNPKHNTQHPKQVLFAAADCTGHGVPGAMVSVVCNNGLNRSVREYGLTEPGKILDKTREIIIQEFEKSEEEVKDGMDIALCSLKYTIQNENLQTTAILQYAGANNPLWVIRKHSTEIEEIKPDKQPIGKYSEPKPYTTHTIELQKGDTIYIFSDGYADQFGGEKGKKFKTTNFKELLLKIQNEPIAKQKELLNKTFNDWKGNLEQLDDVCIIGVKI